MFSTNRGQGLCGAIPVKGLAPSHFWSCCFLLWSASCLWCSGYGKRSTQSIERTAPCALSAPAASAQLHKGIRMMAFTIRSAMTILCGLTVACSTQPIGYDPAAIGVPAQIVYKSAAGEKVQPQADSYNAGPALVGVLGVAGLLLGDALEKKTTIPVYKYVVRKENGGDVVVLSEYFGFSVGDCVTLLESQQPTYPRIAPGGVCK